MRLWKIPIKKTKKILMQSSKSQIRIDFSFLIMIY